MESFGRYLAQQRELRGLSVTDVARETRLSPQAIEALEEDRFHELPARVFVVGYLRNYASCVGLSPDELVVRYDEWRRQMGLPDEESHEAEIVADPPAPPSPWPWFGGAGALLAATLLLLWLLL